MRRYADLQTSHRGGIRFIVPCTETKFDEILCSRLSLITYEAGHGANNGAAGRYDAKLAPGDEFNFVRTLYLYLWNLPLSGNKNVPRIIILLFRYIYIDFSIYRFFNRPPFTRRRNSPNMNRSDNMDYRCF